MSETLEQRIRRVAKEDYAFGKVTAYASDFVEYLDDRDAIIATLTALLKEAGEALGPFAEQAFEEVSDDGNFHRAAEIRKKIQEATK